MKADWVDLEGLDMASAIERGLPVCHLVKRLREGIDATIVNPKRGFTGRVPDWTTRRSCLDMALKLRGMYVTKHEVSGRDGLPIQVSHEMDLAGISTEKLEAALAILNSGPDGTPDPQ